MKGSARASDCTVKESLGSARASDCTMSQRGWAPLVPVAVLCVREVGLRSC